MAAPEFTSSIDNFVGRILDKSTIATPNRYWVNFTFPRMSPDFQNGGNSNLSRILQTNSPGSVNNTFNGMGQLSMMCTTALMPGRQLQLSEHKHTNYPIKIPTSQQYAPVAFGFTLSENLKERRFFELWQDVVVNVRDGTMNFYNEYVSTVQIYQLNKQNRETYAIELREAYPTALSDISYTYAANNELLNMSVTLSYKYWVNLDTDKFFLPT